MTTMDPAATTRAIYYNHADLREIHGGSPQWSLLGPAGGGIQAVLFTDPDLNPQAPHIYVVKNADARVYARALRMAQEQQGEWVQVYMKRAPACYEDMGMFIIGNYTIIDNTLFIPLLRPRASGTV